MTEYDDSGRNGTLADVLESLFHTKRGDVRSFLKIIFAIIFIGWVGDSSLPIIQEIGMRVFNANGNGSLDLSLSFQRFLISFVCCAAYIITLFAIRHSKTRVLKYRTRGSEPRRGLIISLSPYADRTKEKKRDLAQLEKEIDDSTLDLESLFNQCNWGQLAFAVAHHSQMLQRCWICTSPDSSPQMICAAKLVNYVSQTLGGRGIECIEVPVADENDISEVALKISKIYRSLQTADSPFVARDVVANYTGGTSAMSGGMILATLNENRSIEYVNQKYLGEMSTDLLKRIDESLAIVSSETNLVATEKLN